MKLSLKFNILPPLNEAFRLFFTDENMGPVLVMFLRDRGFDVFDTKENNLFASSDAFLLDMATKNNRVVITLDSDFGTLVHKDRSNFLGIVFLRPGHFDSSYHIQTFQALLNVNPDIESPFMIIAEWMKEGVKIRIKNAMLY